MDHMEQVAHSGSAVRMSLDAARMLSIRLFGVVDQGRGTPNEVMRLCTVRLTRLDLVQTVNTSRGYFYLSVGIKGHKQKLRSMRIEVPEDGVLGLDMDLVFSLQYLHDIKEGETLRVLIQKRGLVSRQVKSVAEADVDLNNVLQCPFDGELVLRRIKGSTQEPVARVAASIETNSAGSDLPRDDALHGGDVWSDVDGDGLDDDAGGLEAVAEEDATSRFSDDAAHGAREGEGTHTAGSVPRVRSRRGFVRRLTARIKEGGGRIRKKLLERRPPTKAPYDGSLDVEFEADMPHFYVDSSDEEDGRSLLHAPAASAGGASREMTDEETSPTAHLRRVVERAAAGGGGGGGGGDAGDGRMLPTSETMLQLAIAMNDVAHTSYLVLMDARFRRGKRLLHWLQGERSAHRGHVVSTTSGEDVAVAVAKIVGKWEQWGEHVPLKVVLVGRDSYINSVVQQVVLALSERRRGWDGLRFYLVPVHGKEHVLAGFVSSRDPRYTGLFFTPEWRAVFDSRDEAINDTDGALVDDAIRQYVACPHTHFLPLCIGELFATFAEQSQPAHVAHGKGQYVQRFIRDVHILAVNEDAQQPLSLQLDYWGMDKRGAVSTHRSKGKFNITLRSVPPLEGYPDHLLRMHVFPTQISKKDSLPGVASVACGVSKVTVGGVKTGASFRVVVDGVELGGVTFLSVTARAGTHVKHFPIALATSPVASEPAEDDGDDDLYE